MNGLLRSLHPALESAHLAVVWHGASHRNYDFTPAPTGQPDYAWLVDPVPVPIAKPRGRPSAALMRAWLTCEPRSVTRAAEDLHITRAAASNLLWRLVRDGRAVKTIRTAGYQRRATALYARAK